MEIKSFGTPSQPTPKPASAGAGKAVEKEWTVLFYHDGNNDIEGDLLTSFLTIEEVSDIRNMNLVSQLARAPQDVAHQSYRDEVDGDWNGVRRYALTPGEKNPYGSRVWTNIGEHDKDIDSPVLKDLGDADMSRRSTLSDFLSWGIRSFPARHYMVVLADHGAGFMGALADYKTRKNMPLPEIREALGEAREKTGIKPDVLVMDGCLMGEVEVARELGNEADYLVATESVNFSCLPFQEALKEARDVSEKQGSLPPETLASIMVDSGTSHVKMIPSMIALKPEAASKITSRVKDLAGALLSSEMPADTIRKIFEKTQPGSPEVEGYKPYEDYRDLKHLAFLLANDPSVSDGRIRESARALFKEIGPENILNEYHDPSFYKGTPGENSVGGLSIYLPTDGYRNGGHGTPGNMDSREIEPFYKATAFAKETGWDRVVEKYFRTA
jgi:hypothetical protein